MAQNFVIRASHYALLSLAPFELVRKFWQSVPLYIEGRPLDTLETIERICGRGHTPTQYFIDVNNRIERFCLDHDLDFSRIPRALEAMSSKRLGFHPEVFPLLDRVFHAVLRGVSSHILECMFDRIEAVTRAQMETFAVTVLYKQSRAGVMRYVTAADIRNDDGTVAALDFASYLLAPSRATPCYFERPPLRSAYIVADQRSLGAILWPENGYEIADEVLRINGRPYGRRMSYSAFLHSHPCGLDAARIPLDGDPSVVVMEKSFRCPVRKRVILRAGQAVQAPRWLVVYDLPRTPLSLEEAERHHDDMLGYALGERTGGLKRLEELNDAFLVYLRDREHAEVVYHESRDAVTVGGRQVVRSIPARLLRKMLQEYERNGKTCFEYWELMNDDWVIPNKHAHHLTRRLDRLADTLKKKTDLFVLRRPRRGWVTLEVRRPFVLRVRNTV